jgi:hypothetical protein
MNITLMDGKQPVPLIAEKDAATLIGISDTTLKRIRYAKEIDFYRIGGQVFYSREMIEAFLKKCLQGGE